MGEAAETAPPPDNAHAPCKEAIAACDGDVRATIKALLIANHFLETELARAQAIIATGNAREMFNRNSTFNPDDIPPKDRKDWYD